MKGKTKIKKKPFNRLLLINHFSWRSMHFNSAPKVVTNSEIRIKAVNEYHTICWQSFFFFLLNPLSVFTHEVTCLPPSYPTETCKQMLHFPSTYHRNWLMMVKFKLVNLLDPVLHLPNNFVSLLPWHCFYHSVNTLITWQRRFQLNWTFWRSI